MRKGKKKSYITPRNYNFKAIAVIQLTPIMTKIFIQFLKRKLNSRIRKNSV